MFRKINSYSIGKSQYIEVGVATFSAICLTSLTLFQNMTPPRRMALKVNIHKKTFTYGVLKLGALCFAYKFLNSLPDIAWQISFAPKNLFESEQA